MSFRASGLDSSLKGFRAGGLRHLHRRAKRGILIFTLRPRSGKNLLYFFKDFSVTLFLRNDIFIPSIKHSSKAIAEENAEEERSWNPLEVRNVEG